MRVLLVLACLALGARTGAAQVIGGGNNEALGQEFADVLLGQLSVKNLQGSGRGEEGGLTAGELCCGGGQSLDALWEAARWRWGPAARLPFGALSLLPAEDAVA